MSFHIYRVGIIGSMECGKTRNDFFHGNASKNSTKLKKNYAEKSSKTIGIEIQGQHWGGNRKLSMEGNAV